MIYITGHTYPTTDLDSIASSVLTPKYIKKKFNLESKAIYFGKENKHLINIINKLGFEFSKNQRINKTDQFVLVDHNSPESSIGRKGYSNELFGIIDHHRTCKSQKVKVFKKCNNWGACATIIYYLYKKETILITRNEAQLFYYAIIVDTFNLSSDATRIADKKAIFELKKKYSGLPSGQKVLLDVFELNTKKSIKQRMLEDRKIVSVGDFSILMVNIRTYGEFFDVAVARKYLKNEFDLEILIFIDLKQKITRIYYFGELSKHFQNTTHNWLISRKAYLLPSIEKRLSKLHLI